MANEHLYDELGLTLRVAAGPTTPRPDARARAGPPPRARSARRCASARPDIVAEIAEAAEAHSPHRRAPGAAHLLDLARESMVTRARDLYTFTAANLEDACLVDCGDGLEFFCIGVEPEQRLLLDAVYGLLTLRNGVPIGYALFSALWRSSEVAYNVFETFRGGESAWVYGRMLATIRAMFGADTFTIDPYQLGHHNDEGLESGAWWFYYKLGFRALGSRRCARSRGARRARCAARRATAPGRATLREAGARESVPADRPRRARRASARSRSTRSARRSQTSWPRASAPIASARPRPLRPRRPRRLGVVAWRRWPAGERLFWERWAPLVALLPEIDDWTPAERRDLADIIRAKGGRRESDFVARFDAHPRLGAALAGLACVGVEASPSDFLRHAGLRRLRVSAERPRALRDDARRHLAHERLRGNPPPAVRIEPPVREVVAAVL